SPRRGRGPSYPHPTLPRDRGGKFLRLQKERAPGARSQLPGLSSGRSPITGNQPDQEKQDHGADECSDEADNQSAAGHTEQRREQPPAEERADDADKDIHEDSVAVAADEPPGQGARDTADDQK